MANSKPALESFRVRGSGNLARSIAIPFGSVILCSVSIGVPGRLASQSVIPAVDLVSAVFLVLLFLPIVIRALMLGIWVRRDSLLIRSWLRNYSIQRDDLLECSVARYSGLLNWGDVDGSGKFLKVLLFTTRSGKKVAPRATISLPKSAAKQVRLVMDSVTQRA